MKMLFVVCMHTGGLATTSTVSTISAVAYFDTGLLVLPIEVLVYHTKIISWCNNLFFYVMSNSYGGVVTGSLL